MQWFVNVQSQFFCYFTTVQYNHTAQQVKTFSFNCMIVCGQLLVFERHRFQSLMSLNLIHYQPRQTLKVIKQRNSGYCSEKQVFCWPTLNSFCIGFSFSVLRYYCCSNRIVSEGAVRRWQHTTCWSRPLNKLVTFCSWTTAHCLPQWLSFDSLWSPYTDSYHLCHPGFQLGSWSRTLA